MSKFINKVFLVINLIFILGIILIKISSFINPNNFIYSVYPSLFLLPALLINISFILFWIFFKKWYFILSLLCLILFSSVFKSGISINWNREEVNKDKQKVTILSYNTMNLDYMKKHKKNSPNLVLKYILEQDADILCLQEFAYRKNTKKFNKADMFNFFKDYPYKHFVPKINGRRFALGVATFSKYPIINKHTVHYSADFNLSIYSDVIINGDTLRIINNHLESNRITGNDISETSNLRNNFDSKKIKELTGKLSKKISVAYKKRANQADSIAKIIEHSPYKVICCGDYNDVPMSYTYSRIKGDYLKDAFQESGFGFGLTFIKSLYRFRIDYIMHDAGIESRNFRVGKTKASDHYPIQTELYLSTKK